jgi:undecaprenyl diphosphate synthase
VTAEPASAGPDSRSVPRHVAIIMDGNGRWAKARGLPRAAGLYAFSSENWRRPAQEISDLTGLLRFYLQRELDSLHKEGIRLRILGDHTAFEADVAAMVDRAVARTAGNGRMTLAIALNYGGRAEIVGAACRAAEKGAIDEAAVEAELDTADLPPLDLLIRTSGEHRLSNFLLWQAAYAELLFVDTLWPDFDGQALREALAAYSRRERRYGGL